MLRLDLRRRAVDLEAFRGAFADERHVDRHVSEPCQVFLDGSQVPSLVYVELHERLPEAVAALRSIQFREHHRTRGLLSTSRTFGYAPRSAHRGNETCQAAALAREAPEAHAVIASLASVVEAEYRRYNEALYRQHEQIVASVLDDWRLEGGVFTSGIINRNNRLPYHFDAGNFAQCWSNMLTFKRGCTGGQLVMPELDLSIRVADHSLLMFDGQAILHGVSPFRLARADGWRYTIVFYSLKQMWRCDTKADTIRLAAERRTARERARFAR